MGLVTGLVTGRAMARVMMKSKITVPELSSSAQCCESRCGARSCMAASVEVCQERRIDGELISCNPASTPATRRAIAARDVYEALPGCYILDLSSEMMYKMSYLVSSS